MFSRGGWGRRNSQNKQTLKVFKISRMECYHQLHSSGSTEVPTENVKHLRARDFFFLQVCFIRQGETFNRMNKYS